MIILSVDPSLNSCGYCVLEKVGNGEKIKLHELDTIKHSVGGDSIAKILNIHKTLKSVASRYEPTIFAMEETFVNKNAKTSLTLGMIRGACMTAVSDILNVQIVEHGAKFIKKSITGNGSADKSQVLYMIKHLLPTASPKTDDESDAIAVGITAVLLHNKIR